MKFVCLPPAYFAALLAACCILGCSGLKQSQLQFRKQYQPSNVFTLQSTMPAPIRRVAVLPITSDAGDWQAGHGAGQLQAVLLSELGKAKMFELVSVSPEQLRGWTGKPDWRADEQLPAEFFGSLRQILDCDAVLFAHLGVFRPYRPIAVGWNIKLVEATGQHIIWAIDEVFDSSEEAVANSAELYDRGHSEAEYSDVERSSMMLSPQRFGRYTLAAVFDTLPPR